MYYCRSRSSPPFIRLYPPIKHIRVNISMQFIKNKLVQVKSWTDPMTNREHGIIFYFLPALSAKPFDSTAPLSGVDQVSGGQGVVNVEVRLHFPAANAKIWIIILYLIGKSKNKNKFYKEASIKLHDNLLFKTRTLYLRN